MDAIYFVAGSRGKDLLETDAMEQLKQCKLLKKTALNVTLC